MARYSPRGALGERFTCRPRPGIAAISAPASGTPTTARPHVRRHARRYRTSAATGPIPRSTPQGACFMTSPDVTRTSVAGEVKLYLAVPSPLFSRPALLGPVSGPSSFRHRTRPGSAAGPPRGVIPVHAEHSVLIRSGPRPTAPPSRLRYCPAYAPRTCGRTPARPLPPSDYSLRAERAPWRTNS